MTSRAYIACRLRKSNASLRRETAIGFACHSVLFDSVSKTCPTALLFSLLMSAPLTTPSSNEDQRDASCRSHLRDYGYRAAKSQSIRVFTHCSGIYIVIPSSMAQNVYTSFTCSVHGGSNAWNQETTCCEQGHNVACKQSTDFGETACGLPLTLLLVFVSALRQIGGQ